MSAKMLLQFFYFQILSRNFIEMASSGATRAACAKMYPEHYASEQTSPSPYVISVSSTNYHRRANITVSVKSNSLEGFKGFLCQARRDADKYVTYGKLTPAGNVNMLNNCEQNASLTHADSRIKTAISFIWTAPEINVGDISVVCTIVQEFSIFWTKVSSPKMKFLVTTTESTPQNSQSQSSGSVMTTSSSLTSFNTKSAMISTTQANANATMTSLESHSTSESSVSVSIAITVEKLTVTVENTTEDIIASSGSVLDGDICKYFTVFILYSVGIAT